MKTHHTRNDWRKPRKIAEDVARTLKKDGIVKIHGDDPKRVSIVASVTTLVLRREDLDVLFHVNVYPDDRNQTVYEFEGRLLSGRLLNSSNVELSKERLI